MTHLATSGISTLRYCTPLLPVSAPVILYCSLRSKSAGLPPRQMQKMFWGGWCPAVVSPTMAPSTTRQKLESQSQPSRLLPSNIDLKPVSSRVRNMLPRPPLPRPRPPGGGACCCATAVMQRSNSSSGVDVQVCGRPPGRPSARADLEVRRRSGDLPHKDVATEIFTWLLL